jgi:[CysO sulfur-carrier protein]-S-L-cysteine hydrolase
VSGRREPPATTRARSTQEEPSDTGTDSRVPPVADWQRAADAGAAVSFTERLAGSMPPTAGMPRHLLGELTDWALAGRPNEACGLLAASDTAENGGVPTRFLGLTNAAASPYRYLIDPDEQLRAMLDIDDADEVVWGIVHSHVSSPPRPSATDIGLAAYPDSLYLICSLAAHPPVVRAWSIRDGVVAEVVLEPV